MPEMPDVPTAMEAAETDEQRAIFRAVLNATEIGKPFFTTPGVPAERVEALRIGDIFRANVVDSTTSSFVFEVVGNTEKVDAFIDLMKPLGLVEVSRTGVAAIARGAAGIE